MAFCGRGAPRAVTLMVPAWPVPDVRAARCPAAAMSWPGMPDSASARRPTWAQTA